MLGRGRSDRLQDFRFFFLFLLAMLQFKTSFIFMSGFALITTACFSPGLLLDSEENLSQSFEVLGHPSSLFFNAHDRSSEGTAVIDNPQQR